MNNPGGKGCYNLWSLSVRTVSGAISLGLQCLAMSLRTFPQGELGEGRTEHSTRTT